MDLKEPQNTNNVDDLVYKTMPRGNFKSGGAPLVRPTVPVPVATTSSTAQPAKSLINPLPTPAPYAAPVLAERPETTMTREDLVEKDPNLNANDNSFNLHPAGTKRKYIWIGLAALIGLLIIGGAAYAYFGVYKKSAVSSVSTNTNVPENTTSTIPDNSSDTITPVVISQIPKEWRLKYFNSNTCVDDSVCGDAADPDHDGLTNLQEYQGQTDPNNADSDKDGIADGDEVNIFATNAQNADTSGNLKYPDSVELKTKYNATSSKLFTDADLATIAANIAKFGLHEPTITTIGQALVDFYTNFGKPSGLIVISPPTNQADALDRDTQRADTIKQISFALLQYQQSNSKYPNVTTFDEMIKLIKPLIQNQAINTTDPKNVAPFIYNYTVLSNGTDFKLGYYSETQNQAISISAKNATTTYNKEQVIQRDSQRKADLEQIASLLENYSSDNADQNTPDQKIYPLQASWKTDLAPKYISDVPLDPSTHQDYVYSVTPTRDGFALQSSLETPPTGKKGYLCTADGCTYY
ncbi:MAG: ATPase containing von Willebrand factor type (vWA) protein-like omain [Candidatus Doudnabacteria bacterium]|nr:ATPase containing von Willebrand factor type (vWA) protein-like omain [Candidatus Doudnabacteria bacterium]